MSDLILLAALLDGPQHGWALKKLAGLLSGSGDMHNNLVYPLLKKFVGEGWVRRRSEPGQRGRIRSVYSLTSRGIRNSIAGSNNSVKKKLRRPLNFASASAFSLSSTLRRARKFSPYAIAGSPDVGTGCCRFKTVSRR